MSNYQNIFNLEQAKTILEGAGWNVGTTSPVRQKTINKEITPLEFSLLTLNQPEIIEAANLLKNQWEQIGAKVNIEINEAAEIQEKIRNREYQALLFGQVLGNTTPDLYSFWHSSQIKDPGLNLALYSNSEVDKLLGEITQTLDPVSRKEKYDQFKKLMANDAPAVFLYSPLYLYPTSKQIKGIELNQIPLPSARFAQIANWYIKTKRIWN